MTDGLGAEADGTNRRLLQKVVPLAHLNAIVALRGPVFLLAAMVDTIQHRHVAFDSAKIALGDDLRTVVEALRLRLPVPVEGAQLHFVGRSESSGEFESWIATSEAHPGNGAYQPLQTGTMMQPWAGNCDAETQRLTDMAINSPGSFDPETDGVALMEGQMRSFSASVGGFCQCTHINKRRSPPASCVGGRTM